MAVTSTEGKGAMLVEISRFSAEIGEIFRFDSCATRTHACVL